MKAMVRIYIFLKKYQTVKNLLLLYERSSNKNIDAIKIRYIFSMNAQLDVD